MLIGGSMEDGIGTILGHYVAERAYVQNVPHNRDIIQFRIQRSKFQFDSVQFVFGALEQHELSRLEACQLTRKFRSDRAAGARDHKNLAGQLPSNRHQIQNYRRSSQKIFYPHAPDLAEHWLSVETFFDGRQDLQFYPAFRTLLDNPAQKRTIRRRNCQQDAIDAVLQRKMVQVGDLAQNPDAVNFDAPFRFVSVDESDRV